MPKKNWMVHFDPSGSHTQNHTFGWFVSIFNPVLRTQSTRTGDRTVGVQASAVRKKRPESPKGCTPTPPTSFVPNPTAISRLFASLRHCIFAFFVLAS